MSIPEGFEEIIPEGFEEVKSHEDDQFAKGLKKSAKDALGGVDAAANMVAGIPSYIYSGLQGLGTLMTTGDINKAGNEVTRAQESNFGLGAPKPFTEEGSQVNEMLGKGQEFLTDKAGDLGEKVGGSLGRTNAEIVAGVGLNFLPLPGGKFVHALGKGVERELLGKRAEAPITNKLEALKAKTEVPEGFEEVAPQGDTWVQKQMDLGEKLNAREQSFADKNNVQGELDLRPAESALDENGMPVDMARSLDAQEATHPAQVDLFNEEHRAMSEQQRAQILAEQQARERDIQVPQEDPSIKQQQIEQAYADRQKGLFDEAEQAKQDKLNDYLTEVEDNLRANGYTPKGDGQGPKTRNFNRERRGQGGALDIQALEDGFKAILNGKEVGYLKSNLTPEQSKMLGENANIDIVKVAPEVKGKGVGSALYKAWDSAHQGNIAPSGKTTQDAWNVWKRNYPEKVDRFVEQEAQRLKDGAPQQVVIGNITDPHIAQRVLSEASNNSNVRNSYGQRGAIDLGVPNKTPGSKIAELKQDSPEVAKAKELILADRKREVMSNTTGIDSYRMNVDTPEKVLALAPEAKDISAFQEKKARSVSPGMNSVVNSGNNPFLKYGRDAISKVVRATDELTRQYVTGADGFGAKMKQLSKEELNEVVGALQHADRKQMELSPEALKESGYSAKQVDFIQHIQKMDAAKLEIWNKVRSDLGLPLVKDRAGHFAGNFDGDYKTIVYDKERNVVGVIGTNTLWSNKKIQAQVLERAKKLGQEVSFADTKRQGLGGSGTKANMFTGFQDMLGILAKDDPRFAKIQEIVDAAIKERGDSLYGASLHDKQKKGVWGNEGNKFWEDRDTNTKQALKAFVDYWESGIASHLNLSVEVKLKELMDNPALDHMPRAKAYMNDYIKNFTGRNLGTLGDALNKVIDAPFRYTGIGSSVPREIVNQVNKRSSQMTMGFVNIPFMITQYLQVTQMGMPELMKIGNNPKVFAEATAKAMTDGLKIFNESVTGKKANLDPLTSEAFDYAKKNGLLSFSEYAHSKNIFQGKISKGFDYVADNLPVIGRTDTEAATRPYVFFSAVNMLKETGMAKADIFDTALNITNHAMINYHASEKPLMYARLGVLGQSAGALQTFKHAFLGQLGTFAKDASKGRPGPLLSAIVAMGVLAGVRGVPFYQELDEMVKGLTDKFFHKRMSIADIAMNHSPDIIKENPWSQDVIGSGGLSAVSGVNMQSRLSAADVLPNSFGEAVSPFGSYGVKLAKDAWDLASNRDALAAKNLAVTLAPSGTAKGLVEGAFKVNDKNQTINKKGQVDYQRSPFDSNLRTLSGATSLKESLDKEKLYNQQLNLKGRQDKQKSITEDAERLVAQNTLSAETLKPLLEKYKLEGGDPQVLVNSLIDFRKNMNRTGKERLQGIPSNNIGSVTRYKNYNE